MPIERGLGFLLAALGGLAIGSFLTVCIHRLPRRESIATPGSRCPTCGTPIRWRHNIPLVSYLTLGGRCAACGERVSWMYPVVEFATAILFVAHYAVVGLQPLLVVRLLFTALLVALFFIDLKHRLLPNVLTIPGILAGLVASAWLPPGWVSAVIGAITGGGVLWLIGEAYERVRGEEGMGLGDVKMLAMIGAFLGWPLMLVTMVLASVAGASAGVVLVATGRASLRYALPFGCFLAVAALVASLAGPEILEWYLPG
jgi:leader peptidase (prepilin peptidase) / N-methyltransferase